MVEYTTENTSDEKIVTQLRKLRAIEREKLSNQLFSEYQEGLVDALDNINEAIKDIESQTALASDRYTDIRDRWYISIKSRQNAYKLYVDLCSKSTQIKNKKVDILNTYQASSRRTIKLNEFDVETEQMILAHICGVHLICGNKKALPMLEE